MQNFYTSTISTSNKNFIVSILLKNVRIKTDNRQIDPSLSFTTQMKSLDIFLSGMDLTDIFAISKNILIAFESG